MKRTATTPVQLSLALAISPKLLNAQLGTLLETTDQSSDSVDWDSVFKAAGISAKSKAYTQGFAAKAFFARTIGSSGLSKKKLVALVKKQIQAHIAMDALFDLKEKNFSPKDANLYVHLGVLVAIFNLFKDRATIGMELEFVKQAFLRVNNQKSAKNKCITTFAKALQAMATPAKVTEFRTKYANNDLRFQAIEQDFSEVFALYDQFMTPKTQVSRKKA